LGEADVARDDRLIDLTGQVRLHIGSDLLGEVVARVEHGEHDALQLQRPVQVGADQLDGAQERAEALQRVVLALQRDQHTIGGDQRVDRQEAERGRAVDEDVVVGGAERLERGAQAALALIDRHQLQLGADEVGSTGQHGKMRHLGGQDGGAGVVLAEDRLVDGGPFAVAGDAQAAGGVALGVEIDEEDPLFLRGERGGEVYRGGRLAHPALLVHDRQHQRHRSALPPVMDFVVRGYHGGLTQASRQASVSRGTTSGEAAQPSSSGPPKEAPMKIACVLGQGFEDSEFRVPYDRLKEEGYQVDIIGVKAGEELKGYKGKEKVKADKGIDQVKPDDYDALLIPGGQSPDHLRVDKRMVEFVKAFDKSGKLIAAVCHGPQLLIAAHLVK